MKYNSAIILIGVLIIATFLRVFRLDQIPPSLFGDEVDLGYQAYSLLKTGQDLYGQSLPTLVHSLSEYRAPLFIYSAVPFIGIFGLNEWGVRLPAAFFGVLGVLGIFLLSKKLFNEKIGLLAAGFLTISPWHLQYSRAGFEVTMLLSFLIFGTYFFLIGLEKKWYLLLSAVFFGLTPYIYSTAVVFMPLLLIAMSIFYKKKLLQFPKGHFSYWIPAFVGMTLVILLTPYLFQTLSGNSGERFNIISIFGNQSIKEKVLLAKQAENLPIDQKIFHNVNLTYLHFFTINYLRSFSPEFLFISGDPNLRHSVGDMGQLYFFEALLLGIGLFGIFKGFGKEENQLIFAWLLLAPIPAALTYDGGFHGTRNFLMLVPLMITVSLGVVSLWSFRLKYGDITKTLLILLIVFNLSFYLHRYYNDYPKASLAAWHYGFKEVFQLEKEIDYQFDKVFVNNTYEPSLIRFLFWNQYEPILFHQQFISDISEKNISNGFDGFNIGKYFFGKFNSPFEELLDEHSLWIASARDDITNPLTLTDSRVKLLQTIYSPENEPIFYLITGAKGFEK